MLVMAHQWKKKQSSSADYQIGGRSRHNAIGGCYGSSELPRVERYCYWKQHHNDELDHGDASNAANAL